MFDEFLQIQTTSDFTGFAAKIAVARNRDAFFQEIMQSGMLFMTEDMLTDEELDKLAMALSRKGHKFTQLAKDKAKSAEVIKRLQLLAHCNIGVRAPIQRFLKKVCV